MTDLAPHILQTTCPACSRISTAILAPPAHTHILLHCILCGHITLYPLSLTWAHGQHCQSCGRTLIQIAGTTGGAPGCAMCFHCIPSVPPGTQNPQDLLS